MNPKFLSTKSDINYQHMANPLSPIVPGNYFKANPRCPIISSNKYFHLYLSSKGHGYGGGTKKVLSYLKKLMIHITFLIRKMFF